MTTTIPAEVLQETAYSVNEDVMNAHDPIAIDRQEMPWTSMLNRRKKVSGQAGGSTIVKLKKNGGLDIQFWERRDRLAFGESRIDLELEFPFVNIHMGMELVHDDLYDQGYDITPNGPRNKNSFVKMSEDEGNTLIDIVEEKIEDMYDSWDVKCDLAFLRDGSTDTKAIVGLDGLITSTPTVGSIGGKSRSNPKLQHSVYTGLTTTNGGTMRTKMTQALRACNNNARGRGAKGRVDFIMAGDDFIDGYTAFATANNWDVQTKAAGTPTVDIGIPDDGLNFMNIPIIRNPTFKTLQTLDSASLDWNKRAYMLTSKAWYLCHPKNKDRQFSVPADQSDVRYTRMSIDGRYSLIVTVPDANALLSVA